MARSLRIRISILSVALVLLALAGVLYTTAMASEPAPPSPSTPPVATPPPPAHTPPSERPPMTKEEEEQARAKAIQGARGQVIIVSGPATRGSIVRIAGLEIQLPSDAFVDRYVVDILCIAGRPCPEVPIYELKRGNSTLAVSAPSGAIVEEDTANGEEGAFDFLKEVLRGLSPRTSFGGFGLT